MGVGGGAVTKEERTGGRAGSPTGLGPLEPSGIAEGGGLGLAESPHSALLSESRGLVYS